MNTLALRWLVVCGMLSLLGGCGGGPTASPDPSTDAAPASTDIKVPDVRGSSEADAGATLSAAGLVVTSPIKNFSKTVPAGVVIGQTPSPGNLVKPGTSVSLVVSVGPAITVPDLSRLPEPTARNAITGLDLAVGREFRAVDTTVAIGSVISQSPAPQTLVPKGTAINLVISDSFGPILSTMAVGRGSHTVTAFLDDTALLAGGLDKNGNDLDSAEIYNNADRSFTLLPSVMTSKRHGHTATLLLNGKVLLTGGRDGNSVLATAELYDPTTQTFTALEGTMTQPRYGHSATLLSDGSGRVLLVGGISTAATLLDTAELFDPKTNTFSASAHTPVYARAYNASALLPNGKVLITGGTTDFKSSLDSAEVYDPATDNFTALTETRLTYPRAVHTATQLLNGKILLAGGRTTSSDILVSAELYDPGSDTFTLVPSPMVEYRFGHAATLLTSGLVLITGGFGFVGTTSGVLDNAELYNPQ